jgi:hypothetical protein
MDYTEIVYPSTRYVCTYRPDNSQGVFFAPIIRKTGLSWT